MANRSELSKLVDKADKVFSQFIRKRDTVDGLYIQDNEGNSIPCGYCITCNRVTATQGKSTGHCGHFIPRGCKFTRFDEENCALQCNYCNTYRQGEQYKFGQAIDRIYGKGTAKKLSKLEDKYKAEGYKFTKDELEGIIKYYKEGI